MCVKIEKKVALAKKQLHVTDVPSVKKWKPIVADSGSAEQKESHCPQETLTLHHSPSVRHPQG